MDKKGIRDLSRFAKKKTQPDQSRLLTDYEVSQIAKEFPEGVTGRVFLAIAKAQRDLTASIKDAEWDKRCADEKAEFGLSVHEAAEAFCEARIEALMVKIENCFIWGQVKYFDLEKGDGEWTMRCLTDDEWQELKTTHCKVDHTSK